VNMALYGNVDTWMKLEFYSKGVMVKKVRHSDERDRIHPMTFEINEIPPEVDRIVAKWRYEFGDDSSDSEDSSDGSEIDSDGEELKEQDSEKEEGEYEPPAKKAKF